MGLSNYGDLKDLDEDIKYGYKTIPNVLGITNAKIISILALILSSLLYTQNEHFGERQIIDILFLMQNVSLIIPILFYDKKKNR